MVTPDKLLLYRCYGVSAGTAKSGPSRDSHCIQVVVKAGFTVHVY